MGKYWTVQYYSKGRIVNYKHKKKTKKGAQAVAKELKSMIKVKKMK